MGLGGTVGATEAIILTTALTLEILFSGLAVAAEVRQRGASKLLGATVPSLLGLLTAVGAVGGVLVLGGAT